MLNKRIASTVLTIIILIFSFVLSQPTQASDPFVFNKNLQTGSVHTDVRELQKFLNNNGFILNKSGIGSLGQETTFFGLITKNALIKFQKANKITPAIGYFGPATRRVINKKVNLLPENAKPLENQTKQADQNQSSDRSIKNIEKLYSVSGSITGISEAVVLQNNGQDDLVIKVNQNSDFIFPTALVDGTNYNVTVKSKSANQVCYADDNIGTVNGADIKNVKIACGVNLSYNPFTYIPSSGGSAPVINTYSITFNTNSSTSGTAPASQTKTQDIALSLSTNSGSLVKTGYTFSGWNTAADGTGTNYAVGANYTDNKDVILYANWVAVPPSNLSYNLPHLFVIDQPIASTSPVVTGVVDSYSISPALPTGLLFSTSSGQITGTPTVSTSKTTHTMTATNAGGSATFDVDIMIVGTVVGANGKIWLDRNLGAVQVATSSDDNLAYGDLYQWGRPTDGHELRTSGTQSGAVSNVAPGTNTFIISSDWSSVDDSGAIRQANWGIGGVSNPCPTGFRLPTETELIAEYTSWGSGDATGAFASPLKITAAGVRSNNNGAVINVASTGYYWSSTEDNNLMRYFLFAGGVFMSSIDRGYGLTVRCTANSYAVAYNDNGSTSGTKPNNQVKAHDSNLVLAANSGGLVKTGYTFSGWNTSADGTGISYAAGANYNTNASVTLYAKWELEIVIGSSYQGGQVAYIFQDGDSGYVAGETHGLIAATNNQSTGIVWAKPANQSSSVPDGTLAAIGSGSLNTDHVVAQNGLDSTYAAGIARSYNGGGYNDWYLPSQNELNKLYDSRGIISNLTPDYYWTSTEGGSSNAQSKHFQFGSLSNKTKSSTAYVRAVRSF